MSHDAALILGFLGVYFTLGLSLLVYSLGGQLRPRPALAYATIRTEPRKPSN